MKEIEITQIDFSTRQSERKTDLVAEEKPLHIFLNEEHYVTILCSPSLLKELAVGHLLSEGILNSLDEVEDMRLEDSRFHIKLRSDVDFQKRMLLSKSSNRIIFSTNASSEHGPVGHLADRIHVPKIHGESTVDSRIIQQSVKHLNSAAKLFRSTGGVHVAALYSLDGESLALAEDVGRHNSVDKVVGAAALRGLSFDRCFLATSGRLSGDIVLKAARIGIPVIASMSAALSSGVEVADAAGMTLIAFVRGARMNILTHPDRVEVTF